MPSRSGRRMSLMTMAGSSIDMRASAASALLTAVTR
jgi:hypothetical protein